MNSEDEPSSGLNGRLRPRKSAAPSPQVPNKVIRKLESKPAQDRPKRTSTPSKVAATKPDDLANKSDIPTAPQLLCPYCDRKFASKQAVSKHARRIHLSNTKQDYSFVCLFCSFAEADHNEIIRHMVDSHPNQYFACLECHSRFLSTSELAEHKLNICEKQKEKPYRSKLRQKVSTSSKKSQKAFKVPDSKDFISDNKELSEGPRFNGIVISCELKPSLVNDDADIEDNITTNLILPPSKNLGTNAVIEKNAVIVLDDIQWNKRMPTNFSFHNTDADQILSRLGVVHRSPRTGESTKKDWFKTSEEPVQKFEKCFDTGFYSKVASNVHENLSKFLDGSFNFNPDPESIIKTRKSKNSVVINTAEGFPILLAFQQYSRNVFDGYIPRTLAPKHKWKWESDKSPLNPDDLKRDSHVNNCIITLVSSLDIWTQLCMRRKFEKKFSIPPLEKKTEKQNTISKELKQILESRELPSSSQQVVKYISKPMPSADSLDFPASLGLKPSAPTYDLQPAVLSGEWVRPRCYVCCACGAQTRDSRGLTSHISTQHPNAQVQHYEIVGELLLNADILKHLYVPPSQMSNRTRPLRGFRECTKCKKSISLEDLHQHMLDCAGDTPAVRRKCRYRPFGVRRRRPRLPDNTIRKKIRKDIRTRQTRQKKHMRPRPKIRSEVGDAETIRKMLADLPAKRHRVMVNPMNPSIRPRRKLDKQRNKIIMKRRASEIKNRKQRDMKKNNDVQPAGSNDDDNDNKSSKSDDDNKPLKPRMKRVLTHAPRQSETLKRKVALNRAKRRVKMKEQRSTENPVDPEKPVDTAAGGSSSSDPRGDQLSIDNSPQRVDVSGGPYGTREQSSRGSRSNNRGSRGDQRDGSISGSPNGNMNNSFSPTQNVPLKHSIARLTAETDAHDRSLQYHHLYLMQPPECTEVEMSQHVPSGQQRVFENEAVVTKLDKPPLHFNPPSSMDAYAYHRNKLSKPKKGLNDCIAMLKNKLVDPIPPSKLSHAVQCGNDDRLDCETVVANQRPAALDYHLNMNTRPAEIFSRHQLIPERFIEYPTEANLLAQNFADLPFHYVPTQSIAFDLPPPDSRIDPRYIKSSKQKQNEVQNKKESTRRRSTRSDKNSTKKRDLNTRTSSTNYSVNVATPSKVNSGQGRRSSSQCVSANNNSAAAKRRASASYNRSNSTRKNLNEYEAIMAQQRALEFRQQRITSEAHLMELAHSETYTQTQINKQNQLIAEQMLENYINKKQLAICVDSNYTSKMLTAAYAESLYANNAKHATISPGNNYDSASNTSISPVSRYDNRHSVVSPGNRYDNSKHSTVSPGNKHDSSKYAIVSPGSRNDGNKNPLVSPGSKINHDKRASVSPGNKNDNNEQVNSGIRYDKNKLMVESPISSKYENIKNLSISPRHRYDKHTDVSAAASYDTTKQASKENQHEFSKRTSSSPGGTFDHFRHAAMTPDNSHGSSKRVSGSPRSISDSVQRVAASPDNYDKSKNAEEGPSSQHDKSNPLNVSPGSKYYSKQGSTSPGTNYISKKQAAVAADPNHNNNKHITTSTESHFVNKKQAASSEINLRKQPIPECASNKTNDNNTTPSNDLLAKVPAVYVESTFKSKKAQAIAVENKLVNKRQAVQCIDTNYAPRLNNLPHEDMSISETPPTCTEAIGNNIVNQQQNDNSLSVKSQVSIDIENRYAKNNGTLDNFTSKNLAVTPEGYVSKQVMQCSDNCLNKNVPDEISERDVTSRKIAVQYYTDNEYAMQRVPPPYAANSYDSILNDIEAPLDLSRSTSKDNAMLKEDGGTYATENYDNYGTLDLSNKSSDQENEDVVVDLSVKMSSPRLEICSKLATITNDEMDSATDLSIKTRDADDIPTDLTMKKITRRDSFEYESSRNSNYDDQGLIQDLSGKNTPPEKHIITLSTIDTAADIPTDLSGKGHKDQLSLASASFCNPKDSMENANDSSLDKHLEIPADLSGNRDQLQQSNSANVIRTQDALILPEPDLEKEITNREISYEHSSTPMPECSYVPKVYDSSMQLTPYEEQTSATNSSNPLPINDDMSRSPKNNNTNLLLTNDGIGSSYDISLPVSSVSGNGLNLIASTTAGSIPLYTLSNTILPAVTSKYESTTPVYTLANACISMSKVEPSNIAPLSDAILSIPSTTIVSVAPMYTLTDTTVNPSMNYMHVHNKSTQDLTPILTGPTAKTLCDTGSNSNAKQNVHKRSASPLTVSYPTEKSSKQTDNELDPETAKKIALLPKELVEILGTMPVDHRNQLLNVLPQYVSTPAQAPHNSAADISSASLVNRGVSPTSLPDFDVKPSLGYSPVSSSHVIRPIASLIPGIERLETKTVPLYQPAIESNLKDGVVGKYEPTDQTQKVYEINGNTVIDLTEDDVPPIKEVLKVTEDTNKPETKPNEPIAITPPLVKSSKQKVNEQTASLRAVRIKAPSERNKSISIENTPIKKSNNEDIKSNVEVIEEKGSTLDLDKTLAIQQAEISSTQHNNTTGGKYPLAISPSSTDSGDESIKRLSQRSPVPTIEVVTENLIEKKYEKPAPKTGMVSSSISASEKNPTDVDNDVNIPKTVQNSATLLSTDKDTAIEKNISDGNLTETQMDLSNVSKFQHDEDSDDDISLATMVKQKLIDRGKTDHISKVIDEPIERNIGTKKKNKDKKGKKVGKRTTGATLGIKLIPGTLEDVNCAAPICSEPESVCKNISNNNDSRDANVDKQYTVIENVDNEEENKHSKKRPKKVRLVADTPSVVEKQQIDKINDKSEKDINKENDSTSEGINNKICIEDNSSNLDPANQSCNKDTLQEDKLVVIEPEICKNITKQNIIKEITADPIIKISKCDINVSSFSSKTKESTETKDKKKKQVALRGDQQEQTTINQDPNIHSDSEAIRPSVEETTKGDIASSSIEQPIDYDNDPPSELLQISESESDIVSGTVDAKKVKKAVRSKKPNSDQTHKYDLHEVDNTNIVYNTTETKENTTTPLRRSRRGKSLFLDSTPKEQESALDEVTVEQKAPLTKKQLIFSKLLLDEENPKPSAHSTPEKQDFNKSRAIEDTTILPDISDIENLDENHSQKPKGTKRRISAQFTKKTKKKKSIDESNTTDEKIDTKKTQSMDYSGDTANTTVEMDIDSNKSQETSILTGDLQKNLVKIYQQSKDLNNSGTSNDKQILVTEKRKNNNQISFDLSQSSKPKKCKLNKGDKRVDNNIDDKNDVSKTDDAISSNASEIKTACYNLPLPARRARSKSVVVKSSAYDPYDIDLEDMIEQNEMFKKNEKSVDVSKNRMIKPTNLTTKDANKIAKDDYKDYRTSEAASKDKVMDYESNEFNRSISDSDDSSKSDVPLQKYVEEKEKKIQEVEASLSREKATNSSVDKQQIIGNKDLKRISPNDITQNVSQSQADEELRSEQFMESFGFFSERKPRKSNLLATKKISETFHITNESDDMYFGFKERTVKKNISTDSKKLTETEVSKSQPQSSASKRAPPKRGRKTKKTGNKIMPCYCDVCKKEFKRSDNYLRHQMSLLHITKLSEVELKVKTVPVHEEPNYLIAYKQYLERLKKLTDQLVKKKKKYPKAAAKIVLPSLEEVLADVNETVRDQQRSARGLSRDEALFIDCCELLKESHKWGPRGIKQFGMSGLDILEKALNDLDANENLSDEDCDSITAQNIMESEEVRNLENDLISGLKEAANATRNANIGYQHTMNEFAAPQVVQMVQTEQLQQITDRVEQRPHEIQVMSNPQEMLTQDIHPEEFSERLSSPNADIYDQLDDVDGAAKPRQVRVKKHFEVKEKMYPDIQIEDIDMFEDKFDKIKRKCRSQAAAAKHPQPIVDQTISHKARKKSEKKKGKRSSKKARHQSTHVPTKGALKGFDGIKVSIPTSDINMSAIVPVSESSPKKKKKSSSKKKRDKRDSESSCKYDSDHRVKDNSSKKVDVYEFMDNEDAELFEFRPSTLMERFKSISNNNKDMPSSSKLNVVTEENSSQGSASDGDDFVYMSDDYVGSDDETENSLLSCELGNVKVSDIKKNSPQKRKDVVEKNAVMGKIFKHNAVRAEKKVVVPKEPEKPKANLDQLFDSLLEEEPNSSTLNSETTSKDDDFTPVKKYSQPSVSDKSYDQPMDSDIFTYPNKSRSSSPNRTEPTALSKRRSISPSKDYTVIKKHENLTSKKYDSSDVDYGPSTSKKYDSNLISMEHGPSTSKKYLNPMPKECKKPSPKSYDSVPLHKDDDNSFKYYDAKNKKRNDSSSSKNDDEIYNSYDDVQKSLTNKPDEGISTSYDYNIDMYDQSVMEDETGVARQRARRKCTVGKQNILAETWSSESEPDGGPPRPNSAESDIAGVSRKKKGRKREGQHASGRRGSNRQVAFKKHDVEGRVSSSRVSNSANSGAGVSSIDYDDPGEGTSGMSSAGAGGLAGGAASVAGSSGAQVSSDNGAAAAAAAAAAMPAPSTSAVAGPSNVKGRPRSVAYYWSSEGDDEQEHLQQHGWIVGDSHKKLVTMLAHAKGRKRNNDDKRHLVE